MAELLAKTPCSGLVPVTHGAVTLDEVAVGPITSLAPYRGQRAALSSALTETVGLGWPEPGRSTANGDARLVWTGRDQAFLLGAAPDARLGDFAAITDQSDGWAVLRIAGAGVEDVLARLMPIDLAPDRFAPGHAARTLCGHMTVSVLRLDTQAVQIMGFRSMAGTLVHELETAMAAVEARARLP